jgi:hypothetical protein
MPLDNPTITDALLAIEQDLRRGFDGVLAPREPAFERSLNGVEDMPAEKLVATAEQLVVVPWLYRCTHVGNFLGVPPTYFDLDLRGTTFIDVRGVSDLWTCYRYIDFIGALHQMGISTTSRPAFTPDQLKVWRSRRD